MVKLIKLIIDKILLILIIITIYTDTENGAPITGDEIYSKKQTKQAEKMQT